MDTKKVLSILISICCMIHGYPDPDDLSVIVSEQRSCAAKISAFLPEANTKCCGVNIYSFKMTFGLNASVGQNPWLALIEYAKKTSGAVRTSPSCHGALISGKYIMTAAQCVTGYALHVAEPQNILLGATELSDGDIDCVAQGQSFVCANGVTRIPIDKIIPHPEYNTLHRHHENDIALIRMVEMAPYTGIIRPICLPTEDITLKTGPISFLKAAWGVMSAEHLERSNRTLQVTVPYFPLDQCRSVYDAKKLNVSLWNRQLCAGGQEHKDFCTGDAGAPLLYEDNNTYEVVGIASFGPQGCTSNLPIIYTNVYEYNSWIKSNIVG